MATTKEKFRYYVPFVVHIDGESTRSERITISSPIETEQGYQEAREWLARKWGVGPINITILNWKIVD